MPTTICHRLLAAALATALMEPALAQDSYPSKPIRVVVPYPAVDRTPAPDAA